MTEFKLSNYKEILKENQRISELILISHEDYIETLKIPKVFLENPSKKPLEGTERESIRKKARDPRTKITPIEELKTSKIADVLESDEGMPPPIPLYLVKPTERSLKPSKGPEIDPGSVDILNPIYRAKRLEEQFAHRPFERLFLWKKPNTSEPAGIKEEMRQVEDRLGKVITKSFSEYNKEKLLINHRISVKSRATSYLTLPKEYAEPFGLNVLRENGTLGKITLED